MYHLDDLVGLSYSTVGFSTAHRPLFLGAPQIGVWTAHDVYMHICTEILFVWVSCKVVV
jgi:hypothetical protein